jgi:hypothetical protein
MEFSTTLIKHISSFLSQRKFRVSVGEMSMPRDIKAGVPQGSILPTKLNHPSFFLHCMEEIFLS